MGAVRGSPGGSQDGRRDALAVRDGAGGVLLCQGGSETGQEQGAEILVGLGWMLCVSGCGCALCGIPSLYVARAVHVCACLCAIVCMFAQMCVLCVYVVYVSLYTCVGT